MTSTTRYTALSVALMMIILASLVFSNAQERSAPPGTDPTLRVPDGFAIERVAGPPLVNRPIVADFDERGRLYVADSSGSNDKVDQQLATRPHRIVRLEDNDGDGRFDTSTVFADKMMLPEGTMWFDGSLYVAAPPSIWKLTDVNDDGVADEREEWLQGKTLTGCANDLHGPYLGPDGWIYWTKGAFAQQTYERPGKPPFVTKASHIFRRRPGDAELEPVMTGGMDNPVDVVFTPAGERIFTATFLEHPQAGRRDALVHAIYGGVYGKPHAVIDGHKRTGDLMPVMRQLGPDVPAGLTRYQSRVFGDEYRDSLFAALFNVRKVARYVLEPNGATFNTRDSDFVVSDSRDFHPTDVIEDADGSLLVVDTGPWYKLCCPSSQLAKPEVFGAIYRVRRKGSAATVQDPRGLRLAWGDMTPADLAKLLDDPRPAVVEHALRRVAKLGSAAVGAMASTLKSAGAVEARRNAVWALTRIPTAAAREAVRPALQDRDATVRQAAIHSAALWRDAGATRSLIEALKAREPAVQRAAAEALGRIGDGRAVPDLIAAAQSNIDRTLEHSLTYALIEIGDAAATVAAWRQSKASRSKRVALIALDQIDPANIKADDIVALLDSPDPILKETSWWIAGHHPEWGGALATFFRSHFSNGGMTLADREALQTRLAQFAEHPAMQALLGSIVQGTSAAPERLVALRAMANSRVKLLPAPWIPAMVGALDAPELEVVRQAIVVARSAPSNPKQTVPELREALVRVARNRSWPLDVRVEALGGIQEGLTSLDAELFELLRTGVRTATQPAVRVAAAAVLEKSTLERDQLLALSDVVQSAGPLEIGRLLAPFERARDEQVGLRLMDALERARSRSSLRPDMIRPRLAKYPESVQRRGEALLASVDTNAPKQAQHLERLLPTLAGGDVRRGQDVFNGSKAACASCHAIGYMGGRIGPDLTRIGQIRSERDLLEAILFPNASFARGYEPVSVTTSSGEVVGGVLRGDLPEEVVLGTATGEELRIARQRVREVQPGTISLMPPGIADQLSRQELADLVAFLKAAR
ncbi:MAG: PVC-type heme-binding CxxCH protein [Vicinamibacterales bacterium]